MKDQCVPPEVVRQAIQTGKLPRRRPERTWGGTGSGCPCAVCGRPVTRDEVEIELEFAGGDDGRSEGGLRVHVSCLSAWELELERMAAEGAGERALSSVRTLPKSTADGRISRRGRNEGHERRRDGFRGD